MDPLVALALAVPAALAAYLVGCRRWPFARCFRCGGSARHPSTGMPFFVAAALLIAVAAWLDVPPLVALAAGVALVGLLTRGRSWRSCGWCGGTGRRLRWGRRLMNSTASTAGKAR